MPKLEEEVVGPPLAVGGRQKELDMSISQVVAISEGHHQGGGGVWEEARVVGRRDRPNIYICRLGGNPLLSLVGPWDNKLGVQHSYLITSKWEVLSGPTSSR